MWKPFTFNDLAFLGGPVNELLPPDILTGGDRDNNLTTFKYDAGGNTLLSLDHGSFVAGVAFDQTGNMYTVGSPFGGINPQITTRKYDPIGNIVWEFNWENTVFGVAVDQNGNVYTGGGSAGGVEIAKYDNDANLIWSRSHGQSVVNIEVDDQGNVYIVGARSNSITTRKYDDLGTLIWSVDHGATALGNAVLELEGGATKWVVTVGFRNDNIGSFATTRLYTSNGDLSWSVDHGATVFGVAVKSDLAGGGTSRIYTGGERTDFIGGEFATTRSLGFIAGGAEWSRDHGATVRDIAVDKSGNIYTVGDPVSGITIRKYNSAGTLLESWGRTVADRAIDTFPPNKGAFLEK